MSKKEILAVLALLKKIETGVSENKKLILEVSKKSDVLCDGVGTKKPAGGTGRRTKTPAKTPEERKFTSIMTFFKAVYPETPEKFDHLWAKGEKKKILEKGKDSWINKEGADKEKAQINLLYKSLTAKKPTQDKLRTIKRAAHDEYKQRNKESEDHAEEDEDSESEPEEV